MHQIDDAPGCQLCCTVHDIHYAETQESIDSPLGICADDLHLRTCRVVNFKFQGWCESGGMEESWVLELVVFIVGDIGISRGRVTGRDLCRRFC